MNNRAISGTTSTKYLGIIINQKLNWNQHCNYICSKANGTLGLLRRVLCNCNRDVKSKAYATLVRLKLEYASSTWNPHTKHNINQIEMVQHRAARFVLHDYSRFSHVSPMIKQLGWDTLAQRRLLSQLNLFYKIQQGLVGISLPPEVCPLDRASPLPNVSPYRHIQSNCDIYKFSFYPRSIVMWNQLPISNLPLLTFTSTIMPTIKSMV